MLYRKNGCPRSEYLTTKRGIFRSDGKCFHISFAAESITLRQSSGTQPHFPSSMTVISISFVHALGSILFGSFVSELFCVEMLNVIWDKPVVGATRQNKSISVMSWNFFTKKFKKLCVE